MSARYVVTIDSEEEIDAAMNVRDFSCFGMDEVDVDIKDLEDVINGKVLIVEVNSEYTVELRIKR